MASKKILVLSPFFYPEPISTAKYNTVLAEKLVEDGHQITVLCSHPIFPKWVVEPTDKQLVGMNIKRGGATIKYANSPIIRRFQLEIWYLLYVLINLPKLIKSHDIVVPIFPPSLFFSFARFFIPKSKSVVGIVHDLQGVYAQGKGTFGKILNRIILFFENMAFNRCDKLIFLSNAMKESALANYHINANQAMVCYPFITITPSEKTTDQLSDIFTEGVSHVVYSGGLGEKQHPLGLLDVFTEASKTIDNTHFHIFSAGPLFEKIKSQNTEKNIFFHPLVPEECLTELYKKSSVQIIPQLPNTADGSLPSKLPNLLASGCPIMAICDPNTELDILLSDMPASLPLLSWDNGYFCTKLQEILEQTVGMSREDIRAQRSSHPDFPQFYINYLVEVVSSKAIKK